MRTVNYGGGNEERVLSYMIKDRVIGFGEWLWRNYGFVKVVVELIGIITIIVIEIGSLLGREGLGRRGD